MSVAAAPCFDEDDDCDRDVETIRLDLQREAFEVFPPEIWSEVRL